MGSNSEFGCHGRSYQKVNNLKRNLLSIAHGGRIKKAPGGIMNLGGLEKDYRTTGWLCSIGAYEKKR